MAGGQVVVQFKENAGFHPAGIVAGYTQLDGEAVHGTKGGFQAVLHQKIGIVVEQPHGAFSVELIAAYCQLCRQVVEGEKFHQLAHTHPEPEFLADGLGFFPGDAGDFRQAGRFPLHDEQGLVAEMLHDAGGGLGADALDDPGGEVA